MMDIAVLGSIASLVGVGTTLLQWLTQTKQQGKQATIDEYLEWLRRENHQELVGAIERTAGMLGFIEGLINDLASKMDDLPNHLEPMIAAAQTAILTELAATETRIGVQLAQLDDMLKFLQSDAKKPVPEAKEEFEIGAGNVLRTTMVRTNPREVQFGIDITLVNRRPTMTTVVALEALLEYQNEALWATIRRGGRFSVPRHGGAIQVRAETPLVSDKGGLPQLAAIRVKTLQDKEVLLNVVDQSRWERLQGQA